MSVDVGSIANRLRQRICPLCGCCGDSLGPIPPVSNCSCPLFAGLDAAVQPSTICSDVEWQVRNQESRQDRSGGENPDDVEGEGFSPSFVSEWAQAHIRLSHLGPIILEEIELACARERFR